MVTARTYGQHCGIAHALDLVGERWALLVVRELILGPKRFTDLRHGLPGVATNVLTQRLKELERSGIVGRRILPPPAASTVYELTDYGRELEPIVLQLGAWASQTMDPSLEKPIRSEWLMVALKALFRPEAAEGVRTTIALRFPDGDFTIHIGDLSLRAAPGWTGDANLTLDTTAETLLAFLAGAPVPADALAPDGDLSLLERLPAVFAFGSRRD